MKIGINLKTFNGWAGGVDFIRHITCCLDLANENKAQEINILIPKNDLVFKLKKILYPLYSLFSSIIYRNKIIWQFWPGFDQIYLEDTFAGLKNVKKILIDQTLSSDFLHIQKSKFDILFPCIHPPSSNYKFAWIGYLHDFQHKYMPENFDKKTISTRNKEFKYMLMNAKHIIVNSNSVKKDIRKFYVKHNAKIHVLPFCPAPKLEWLKDQRDCREDYKISKPYFIICNQFWKHKNHEIAFKAFSSLLSKVGKNFELVCTGQINDTRNPNYFDKITKLLNRLNIFNDVKIIGHVPKINQISLLKKSIAVIQPTLFEGGPGGGASYDAVSLGHPLIISNINVNKEIDKRDRIFFFDPKNQHDLTKKMIYIIENNFSRYDSQFLWKMGQKRMKECGMKLIEIAEEAYNDF